MVIENTYPKLSQIYQAKFELGGVKQFIVPSDHVITARDQAKPDNNVCKTELLEVRIMVSEKPVPKAEHLFDESKKLIMNH